MKIYEEKYYNVTKSSSDGKFMEGSSFFLEDDELVIIGSDGSMCGYTKDEYKDFAMDFEAKEDNTMIYEPLVPGGDYVWTKKKDIAVEIVGVDDPETESVSNDIFPNAFVILVLASVSPSSVTLYVAPCTSLSVFF